jgi:glycosyltransferase involved in cell wall biosynthesis
MNPYPSLDIGFWFPRPERGAMLADELRRLGHQVTIYHSLPIPGDQAWVRHVKYGPIAGMRAILKLNHDVFYTPHSFIPVLQLLLNKWVRSKPYVYTLNGAIWSYYNDRRSPISFFKTSAALYEGLLRAAVRGAGVVVANSGFLAAQLATRFPAYAQKITPIYNGIAYDAIDTAVKDLTAWGSGEPRLLSVLTLNFEGKARGALLLIDAFDEILRCYPNATYVVAAKSEKPEWVALFRAHLQRLVGADRIRIELNHSDVPSLLAAADLFLYATAEDSSDSLPRALLEAQAAGVPIVTTDTTGCAEVVSNRQTGRAVAADAQSITAAALDLLSDPAEAQRMAVLGAASIRGRFNWQAMAGAYAEAFSRAVTNR